MKKHQLKVRKMNSLHVLILSIFAFQLLLFPSAQTAPLGESTVKVMNLRPPRHPRRHPPPPPTPGYSPEPGPGKTRRSPPTPSTVFAEPMNSLCREKSPFSPSSASA
ncbi:U1 small nuclear ribonucleoprotein C-like [Vigna radiata var. radiata]|uniref:U1 small nuclear ribonucleoprotein C-like n=1 Tax=Vigna radiata var. radiata TaxID=3916 RepID=A0A3Q0EY04_VIGRR|nr:U1 small nuclear ribonucleoprotein C-like [Vigna radiata var. radiata]